MPRRTAPPGKRKLGAFPGRDYDPGFFFLGADIDSVKMRYAYDINLALCCDADLSYDAEAEDHQPACDAPDFCVPDVGAESRGLGLDASLEEEYEPILLRQVEATPLESPYPLEGLPVPDQEIEDILPESYLRHRSVRSSWVGRVLTKEALPSITLSGCMHLCLLLLLTILPTYGKGGVASNEQGSVMVKLVEQDSDEVPTDESPGSRDAPASLPMAAKRSPEAANKAAQPLSVPQQTFLDQSESGTKEAAVHDEDERKERHDAPTFVSNVSEHSRQVEQPQVKDSRPDDALKDRTSVDSVHAYDSAPSLPSVASPPRRASGAPGAIGDEYRNKILSAISAAAFYPKRALAERIYGETIVTFTINKSGSIIHLSVKKPSGYNVLDDAAMTIVKKASKHFPSIPDELTTDSLSYDVPIIFKKRS